MTQCSQLYELLVELNAYQGELATVRSINCQIRKCNVLAWYNSLSLHSKWNVSRIDATLPIVNDFCAIFQHLLISDPCQFERSNRNLIWQNVNGEWKIKFVGGDCLHDNKFSPSYLIEREFLCAAGIVWEGMRLVDISFVNVWNLTNIMQKISSHQCFTFEPLNSFDLHDIRWLRLKTRFSVAQLLVALLELNLWRHWKERNSQTQTDKSYARCVPSKVLSMSMALERIATKCGNTDTFRKFVEIRGKQSLRQILVTTSDNRIPLYLTIMKKRLSAGWYNDGNVVCPSQYTPQIKSLWVLSHLLGVMQSNSFRKFIGSEVAVLQDPHRTSRMSTAEVIRGLLTIPLFDSFSLIHEIRISIRDGIISDFAFADLLNADRISVEVLAQEGVRRSGLGSSRRSKRVKKRRGKCGASHVSTGASHQSAISLGVNPLPSGQGDASMSLASLSHSLAPRAVTKELLDNTKVRVIIGGIVDFVINRALEAADANVTRTLLTDMVDTSVDNCEVTQQRLTASNVTDISLIEVTGVHADTCDLAGCKYPCSDANAMQAAKSTHQVFSRWILGESWTPSNMTNPTSPPSTSSRFGGLFGAMPVKSEGIISDDSSFFQNALVDSSDATTQSTRDSCDVGGRVGNAGMNHHWKGGADGDIARGGRDQTPRGSGEHINRAIRTRDSSYRPCDISKERKRRHSHDIGSGNTDGRRPVSELMAVQSASSTRNVSPPQLLPSSGVISDEGTAIWRIGSAHQAESELYPFSLTGAVSRPRTSNASGEPRARQQRSLSPTSAHGQSRRDRERARERMTTLESRVQYHVASTPTRRGGLLSPDDCGSVEGAETDFIDNMSFGDSSGFGFGLDGFDSMLDSEGFGQEHGTAYFDYLSTTLDWSIPFSGSGGQPLLLAIACSCLRSQADGACLRNFVALQRSLIGLAQQSGMQSSAPYYHEQAMNMYSIHPRRELEVMSDGGDFAMFSRHSNRRGEVGGAATLSSLCFHRSTGGVAVDDAGVGRERNREFSQQRISVNSRSFSETGRTLDGISVRAAEPDGFESTITSSPLARRVQSGEPYGSDKYEFAAVIDPMRSGDTFLNDEAKSEVMQLRAADEVVSTQALSQRRTHSFDESVPLGRIVNTAGSKFETNEPILPSGGHERVADTQGMHLSSPASEFLSPAIHSFCTMSEYGGGIPSPLTIEICSFVNKIDQFSASWHSHKVAAIDKMSKVVQSLWPRAQVKAFGSFVSGLSLPSSDLDLVICLPKVHREAGPEAAGFLEGRNAIKETWQQNLARCLSKETWVDVSSIKVISNTAVPIIKLKALSSNGQGVPMDVSFEGLVHQGLEANKLCVMLMDEFLSLRPIVLVLKQFLSRRGLCESFTGGLSSYALLLITARFLQEQPPNRPLDIGALLLGVLDFFGNRFQPAVTGISVGRRCYFSRMDYGSTPSSAPFSSVTASPSPDTAMAISSVNAMNKRHSYNRRQFRTSPGIASNSSYYPCKFDPLFIEDPLAQGNNVGRNCFRINQIQRLWSEVHSLLLEKIGLIESGIAGPTSLISILVGESETVF